MWDFVLCFVHIIFFKTELKCNSGHFEKAYGIGEESRMSVYVQLSLDYKL